MDNPCDCWLYPSDKTPVSIGDHVSVKTYPKGTLRGEIEQSNAWFCSKCGKPMPVIVYQGRAYDFTQSTKKLQKRAK